MTAISPIAKAIHQFVCLSVTLSYYNHIGWNSSKTLSQLVSLGVGSLQTPTSWIYSKGKTPKFWPKVTHPCWIECRRHDIRWQIAAESSRDSAMVTMGTYQHRSFECFDWWLPTTSPSPNMGVSNALLVICWISNGHISAVGHVIPIHFMFWSRVEFSGSTERMALFWFYQTQDGGHDITWKDINDSRVMSPFAKLLWPFFT